MKQTSFLFDLKLIIIGIKGRCSKPDYNLKYRKQWNSTISLRRPKRPRVPPLWSLHSLSRRPCRTWWPLTQCCRLKRQPRVQSSSQSPHQRPKLRQLRKNQSLRLWSPRLRQLCLLRQHLRRSSSQSKWPKSQPCLRRWPLWSWLRSQHLPFSQQMCLWRPRPLPNLSPL